MSRLFGDLITWVVDLVDRLGYVGLAIVVAIENIFPPIPSEAILPLAGFLAAQGRMTLVGAIVASTIGSVVGALVLYAVGYGFGERRVRVLVRQYGRWALISEDDLDKAQAWFDRYGRTAVLVGRLAPLVRSLISIPAGVARMPLLPFVVYTTIGSGFWNVLLIGGGWILGENWELITTYQGYFSYVFVAALGAVALWFVAKRFLGRSRGSRLGSQPAQD